MNSVYAVYFILFIIANLSLITSFVMIHKHGLDAYVLVMQTTIFAVLNSTAAMYAYAYLVR